MTAIIVGPGANDLSSYLGAYTAISKTNPANASGQITHLEFRAYTAVTGLRMGVFYSTGTNKYKCRASVSLGNVGVGVHTFDAPGDFTAFGVESGDFLGRYVATGFGEFGAPAGSGCAYISGEYIDAGDEATYTPSASNDVGIYATGSSATVYDRSCTVAVGAAVSGSRSVTAGRSGARTSSFRAHGRRRRVAHADIC